MKQIINHNNNLLQQRFLKSITPFNEIEMEVLSFDGNVQKKVQQDVFKHPIIKL